MVGEVFFETEKNNNNEIFKNYVNSDFICVSFRDSLVNDISFEKNTEYKMEKYKDGKMEFSNLLKGEKLKFFIKDNKLNRIKFGNIAEGFLKN